jgi:alpha/beta superfamily hydrolase
LLEVVSRQAALNQPIEVRSSVELPSLREAITLHTSDGLKLIGELATPLNREPVATLIMLHPLPTHGGFMDSHVYRKAANRLPALADLAVLRFNTRGTTSPHGTSEGDFGEGVTEVADVQAAVAFAVARGLPNLWIVGWSFGTELALKYAIDQAVLGAILLSPPLHRTSDEELQRWNESDKRLVAVIPEFDDYLTPQQAEQRFALVKAIELVPVDGAKHLWVGEAATKRVLDEIVRVANPARYPLPETFIAN